MITLSVKDLKTHLEATGTSLPDVALPFLLNSQYESQDDLNNKILEVKKTFENNQKRRDDILVVFKIRPEKNLDDILHLSNQIDVCIKYTCNFGISSYSKCIIYWSDALVTT